MWQSGQYKRRSRRSISVFVWLGVGVLLAATFTGAARTSPPDEPAQPPLMPYGESTLDRYFERLRRDFAQLDADGDGSITQADVDLHALMEGVMMRTFAEQYIMRFDLDGDGLVTEDEIRRGSRYYFRSSPDGTKQRIEDDVRSMMALDTDKDGKVSVVEASRSTVPEMQQTLGFPGESRRAREALTLKAAPKDGVTLQDYTVAGEALFRRIDADRDGKISQEELAAFRRKR